MSRSIVRSKINAKYNPASVGGGGGGTPAPPDKAIQFNQAGAFGASAAFFYDYPSTPTTNTASLRLARNYDFLLTPMAPIGAAGIQIKNSSLSAGNPEKRSPFITSHSVQISGGVPNYVMKFEAYDILDRLQILGFKCDYSVDVFDDNTDYTYSRIGTLLCSFPKINDVTGNTTSINVVDSFIVSLNTDPAFDLNLGFFTASHGGTQVRLTADFSHIAVDSIYFTGLFTIFMNPA